VGCATVTPDKVVDNTASYDASTPTGYDNLNSGIIGFTAEGYGILTPFGVERYNKLIELYKIQFKFAKGVELVENEGITEYLDKNGNLLYKIDQQHLVYYGILNSWRRDGKDSDGFWDKAKNLIK
jgi:hypothetical protein